MDVVSLGELLVDMFPSETGVRLAEVTSFQPKPGGASANVAVSLARLGIQSAFVGKVGNDAFGLHLGQILAAEGVDIRGLRYDDSVRTTLAFIAKPDPDTAEFLFYRNPGADTRLTADELDRQLLEQTKILHLGSLSIIEEPTRGAAIKALEIVKASDGIISLDVNYRPTLWDSAESARREVLNILHKVNLLKVNENELELLSGTKDLEEGSRRLIALGPEVVVATLGAHGSYFRTQNSHSPVSGFQVETIDATGCGDAFVAGILSMIIKNRQEGIDWADVDWKSILRFGNGVGALTARRLGVIPALPARQEVTDFIKDWDQKRELKNE